VTASIERGLIAAVGESRVRRDAALGPLTTFRVGGPADWLVEARTRDEILGVIAVAREAGVPVTVLGGGSNVLVADAGVRGVVVRIHGGEVRQIDRIQVEADAGVTINGLVRWTINRGVAGLEAWAGTPGTVGGAIHGNAHFRGQLIGALVHRVTLAALDGRIVDVRKEQMEFGYDYSRLHRTGEVVVAAVFDVATGQPDDLRRVARESLAFRKRTQPLESASAGCVFQNPDPSKERVPDGIPPSAGALVDRAGLKDARAGRARVSTTHANFIVNEGGASADQIRSLIDRCKDGVWSRFGVALREEIVYLGFSRTAGDEERHGHTEN
jgi:UDP-N-acetylmuramate dehydrogenase